MKRATKLSLRAARAIALKAQLLDGGARPAKGKKGALQIIERLGYVQIDTIAVVERAHHHVLWSRRHSYRPEMLDSLLSEDRSVFEHWRRAASYLPMSDYRFYTRRMHRARESERNRNWIENNAAVMREVRRRIRREGPLPSSAFAAPSTHSSPGSRGNSMTSPSSTVATRCASSARNRRSQPLRSGGCWARPDSRARLRSQDSASRSSGEVACGQETDRQELEDDR